MPVGKLWASSLGDRREGVLSQAVLQSATSTYLIWLESQLTSGNS